MNRTPTSVDIVIGEFGFRFFVDLPEVKISPSSPSILRTIFPDAEKSLICVLKDNVESLLGINRHNLIFLNSSGFRPHYQNLFNNTSSDDDDSSNRRLNDTIFLFFKTKFTKTQVVDYNDMTYDYFVKRFPQLEALDDRIKRTEDMNIFLNEDIYIRQQTALSAIIKNKQRFDPLYEEFDGFIKNFPEFLGKYYLLINNTLPRQLEEYSNQQKEHESSSSSTYFGEFFLSTEQLKMIDIELEECRKMLKGLESSFQEKIDILQFPLKYRTVKNFFDGSINKLVTYDEKTMKINEAISKNRMILKNQFLMVEELQLRVHEYEKYKKGFDHVVYSCFEKLECLSILLLPASCYFFSDEHNKSNQLPNKGEICIDKKNMIIGRVFDHLKYALIIEFVQRRSNVVSHLHNLIASESKIRSDFFDHLYSHFKLTETRIKSYFRKIVSSGLYNWDSRSNKFKIHNQTGKQQQQKRSPQQQQQQQQLKVPDFKFFFDYLVEKKLFCDRNLDQYNQKIMDFLFIPFLKNKEKKKKVKVIDKEEQEEELERRKLMMINMKKNEELIEEMKEEKIKVSEKSNKMEEVIKIQHSQILEIKEELKELHRQKEEDMKSMMTETQIEERSKHEEFVTEISEKMKKRHLEEVELLKTNHSREIQRMKLEVENKFSEVQSSLKQSEEEASQKNGMVESLNRQLERGREQEEQLKIQMSEQSQQIQQLNEIIKKSSEQQKMTESMIRQESTVGLQKNLKEMKRKNEALRNQLRQYNKAGKRSKENIKKLTMEKEKVVNNLEYVTRIQKNIVDENKRIKAENKSYSENLANLQDRHAEMSKKVQEADLLSRQAKEAEENVQVFQKRVDEQTERVQKLTSQKNKLAREVESGKSALARSKREVTNLVEDIGKLLSKNEGLELKFKDMKKKILELDGKVNYYLSFKATLERKNKKQKKEYIELQQELTLSKMHGLDVEKLRTENKELTSVCLMFKEKLEYTRKQLKKQQQQDEQGGGLGDSIYSSSTSSMEYYKNKIKKLKDQIEELRDGNRKYYHDKLKLTESIEELKSRLEQVRVELNIKVKEVLNYQKKWKIFKVQSPEEFKKINEF